MSARRYWQLVSSNSSFDLEINQPTLMAILNPLDYADKVLLEGQDGFSDFFFDLFAGCRGVQARHFAPKRHPRSGV